MTENKKCAISMQVLGWKKSFDKACFTDALSKSLNK